MTQRVSVYDVLKALDKIGRADAVHVIAEWLQGIEHSSRVAPVAPVATSAFRSLIFNRKLLIPILCWHHKLHNTATNIIYVKSLFVTCIFVYMFIMFIDAQPLVYSFLTVYTVLCSFLNRFLCFSHINNSKMS